MLIDKSEITNDSVEKVLQCKSVEELMALAKAEGMELTKEEAEAYLSELDDKTLVNVAGGNECMFCPCQSDYQGRSRCSDLGTH